MFVDVSLSFVYPHISFHISNTYTCGYHGYIWYECPNRSSVQSRRHNIYKLRNNCVGVGGICPFCWISCHIYHTKWNLIHGRYLCVYWDLIVLWRFSNIYRIETASWWMQLRCFGNAYILLCNCKTIFFIGRYENCVAIGWLSCILLHKRKLLCHIRW